MRRALRRLARNDRVVGIAAAVAIGYTLVAFVTAAARVVFDVVADREYARGEPFMFEIAGHDIVYEIIARQGAVLVLVVLLAAAAVRHAAGDDA